MTSVVTVLFNGIAYGILLFIMSVGLSVTMGMMNFVNLAQASFSMFGGYVVVAVTQQFGVPFLASLPIAFVVVGLFSIVIERVVFRHFYGTDDLTQVSAHHRPRFHVDCRRQLFLGRHLSARRRAGLAQRPAASIWADA